MLSKEPGINDLLLEALGTDHAHVALRRGDACAYRPDIGPFAALAEDEPGAWADLAALVHTGLLVRTRDFEPDGWTLRDRMLMTTMTALRPHEGRTVDTRVVRLTEKDLSAMTVLAGMCDLHTFSEASLAISSFYGIFDDDRLVSMAALRFSTPSWREIGCVGTDPEHRGAGYARALIETLIIHAASSRRRAFLLVEEGNPASHLYRKIGFTPTRTDVVDLRVRD